MSNFALHLHGICTPGGVHAAERGDVIFPSTITDSRSHRNAT